ncbi:MAG: pyrroline-5-carboxylate reductase [Spirochaetaceae bacterium]|jgi:pyrroline-5-carboxylate reductase|nr:pyrroline-5-carboxylate reductase [Spirochaetaceae bacterium]
MKIACIGSGNMGTALMKGAAGVAGGGSIGFSDKDRAKAEAAARAVGGKVYASNSEAAASADFVFLAVKPQVLGAVLEEIAAAVKERTSSGAPAALVSMAAGWSIGKIQETLRGSIWNDNPPVIRIMPNTPALIGQGLIAFAPSAEVSPEQIGELKKILAGAGAVDCIDEQYLNGVTGLSGCGPAFVYIFIEALSDAGVRAGLPRDRALQYAVQTVLGAAAMVKETGRHPGELKDMVASPGGATIAGIAALENGAFRGIVMSAVQASFEQAKTLE